MPSGPPQSPRGRRPHRLSLNAWVVEGRLHVEWTYGARVHRRETIQALAAAIREGISASVSSIPGYEALLSIKFARPVSQRSWLQTSNPSERWKWDFMFQDLPPVKGHNVQMEQMSQPTVIPLRLVTEEISRASE